MRRESFGKSGETCEKVQNLGAPGVSLAAPLTYSICKGVEPPGRALLLTSRTPTGGEVVVPVSSGLGAGRSLLRTSRAPRGAAVWSASSESIAAGSDKPQNCARGSNPRAVLFSYSSNQSSKRGFHFTRAGPYPHEP